MKKSKKEIVIDVIIILIIIALYVFVFLGIYTNFRERKRKEIRNGIINKIDDKIDINRQNNSMQIEENIIYKKLNYTVLGKIRIKKIDIYEPILKENTKLAYDTAVVKMYGPNLNTNGNVVLGAHNFMRGNYFIKINKLVNNDVVTITDLSGNSVDYYVYEYKITSIDDASYLKNTNLNEKIITLVTCTKGGKERYYVKAKAK